MTGNQTDICMSTEYVPFLEWCQCGGKMEALARWDSSETIRSKVLTIFTPHNAGQVILHVMKRNGKSDTVQYFVAISFSLLSFLPVSVSEA
jgi:hypothetical protein